MNDAKFDPTAVPTFPVVRLALTGAGAVLVDDVYVATTGSGQDAISAGVVRVAQIAREQGLEAVRARALTGQDTFDMVVTADGETYDLTPPTEPNRARRRRLIATGAVAGVLLAAGLGTGAGVVLQERQAQPAVTEQPFTPPGAGANLPVLAPPGFSQRAAWSVPVDSYTPPVVLADGSVVAVAASGALTGWDTTGRRVWSGAGEPGEISVGVVDGRPVLMSGSWQDVSLWPLDTSPAEATVLQLSAQADVDVTGTTPLVVLPDQTVEVLGTSGLVRRDVPVGATPVAATGAGVVAASSDSWWLITADDEPAHHALPVPAGTTGDWTQLVPANDTHLVGVWPASEGQVAAVLDLVSGQVTAATALATGAVSAYDVAVRDPHAEVLVLGGAYVDYSATPRVVDLGEVSAEAVAGPRVYGAHSRTQVVADITSTPPRVEQYATGDQPTGDLVAVTDDFAYVLAHKVDATYLYALPSTTDAQEQ